MSNLGQKFSSNFVLDLMLQTLINSSELNDMHPKNWEAIAKLVPGTTPSQVARRYESLVQSGAAAAEGLCGHSSLSGHAHSIRDSAGSRISDASTKFSRESGAKYVRASTLIADAVSPRDDPPAGRSGRGPSVSASLDAGSAAKDHDAGAVKRNDPGGGATSSDTVARPAPGNEIQGPNMVIHVCDEAKNLKQDFSCPRDLLVQEMRYFAEYLTTDAQRWEDVDISVHCDVHIFDWLMRYVKRNQSEESKKPKLEPNNVISILISSDFLKMDCLVEECIRYCHDHMSAIVATPCNMNCISDKLVTRIAGLFTHNEADEIKDRKDKFKSKIFAKMLEKLFDPRDPNPSSPENASTLHRCSNCRRLLTRSLESKLNCVPARMTMDKHGYLVYSHVRDASWDVNDWLLDLKAQLKTWRDVYWRVWGSINYLKCSRCQENFPLIELSHCRFHPEAAQYEADQETMVVSPVGVHPCCGQVRLRFDPTGLNRGCRTRDHVVNLTSSCAGLAVFGVGSVGGATAADGAESASAASTSETEKPAEYRVYEDLLAHRDIICTPYQKILESGSQDLNVFEQDEFVAGWQDGTPPSSTPASAEVGAKAKGDVRAVAQSSLTSTRSLQGGAASPDELDDTADTSDDDDEDDEIGDEEPSHVIKTGNLRLKRLQMDPQGILLDAPNYNAEKKSRWDSNRSLRWNQDAQREEDQSRLNEIIAYLTKMRTGYAEKAERLKSKEYSGGIFCKLESQWRQQNLAMAGKGPWGAMGGKGGGPAAARFRPKPNNNR